MVPVSFGRMAKVNVLSIACCLIVVLSLFRNLMIKSPCRVVDLQFVRSIDPEVEFSLINFHLEKTGGTSFSKGIYLLNKNSTFLTMVDFPVGYTLLDFNIIFGHAILNATLTPGGMNWKEMNGNKTTPTIVSAHPESKVPFSPRHQWITATTAFQQGHERMRRHALTSTVLRYPSDRVMSSFYHFYSTEARRNPHDLTLDEWQKLCQQTGALYVHRFSDINLDFGSTDPLEFMNQNSKAVESAINNLMEFDIIARTECVPEFLGFVNSIIFNQLHPCSEDFPVNALEVFTQVGTNKKDNKSLSSLYRAALLSPLDGGFVLDHFIFEKFFSQNLTDSSCSLEKLRNKTICMLGVTLLIG